MTQNTSSVSHSTLTRALLPQHSLLRDMLLVLGGALLVAVFAQTVIPLHPVPVTLQTLGVFLVGAALGWKRGLAAMLLYLGLGAVGLPVFAGGKSVASLMGPSAGYLFSYPLAAAFVGFMVQRFGFDRRPLSAAVVMLLASVIVYALGLAWLGMATGMSGDKLFSAGLYPFIVGDLLKIAIAAALLPTAWRFVNK